MLICYTLYLRFGKARKDFEFFICHHKVGSGAYARLLKLALKASNKVRRNIFVDCDNLHNLDTLFDFVANDTETLVVIGTKEVFSRPWCAGEITMACSGNIPTVLVRMPDYEPPDEAIVKSLMENQSGMAALIENGIELDMLEQGLEWIKSVPQIVVFAAVSLEIMDSLVEQLLTHTAGELSEVKASKFVYSKVVIISDFSSMEVQAAAYVLKSLLGPLLVKLDNLPSVLPNDETFPKNVDVALAICFNGCMERAAFLNPLLAAYYDHAWVLPIMVDTPFRFPDLQESYKRVPHGVTMLQTNVLTTEQLLDAIRDVFKEIALPFSPNMSSETVLLVHTSEIADRIQLVSARTHHGVLACRPSRLRSSRVTKMNSDESAKAA
jgi:hypothetical protein